MKFIPGTRFINRTGKNTRLFLKNKIYTLHDIKKNNNEGITYIFLVDKELKEIKFKSIKQAEEWLGIILA